MTEPHATAQIQTRRHEMGLPMPRRFSQTAWWRFARDRRRRYLAELGAPPTSETAARIEAMVRLEWSALRSESEAMASSGREAREAARESREHRRLLDRLSADHVAAAKKTNRKAIAPSLENLLAAGR